MKINYNTRNTHFLTSATFENAIHMNKSLFYSPHFNIEIIFLRYKIVPKSKKGQPNLSKLRLLAAVGVETVEGNQLVPGAPDGFQ